MNAIENEQQSCIDHHSWTRLQRLEAQHRRLQSECDVARRGLDGAGIERGMELREAWKHYCEVIAELDQTTAQIEVLRVKA